MKKLTIWDVIISLVTLGGVCACLVPAVARLQRTPEDAKCQSNMRRFAAAIRLYTADNGKRYPTNRMLPSMFMTSQMFLSPKKYDENGNPIRFVYGINWVEALYPYLIADAQRTGRDWESFLRCPNASNAMYPVNSMTARVTYAFNYNLLERYPDLVGAPEKLMMMREMDRLVEAVCRPVNDSTGLQDKAPMSPFLTSQDYMMRGISTDPTLHGQGSHIMFADGHVKYFSTDYFPPTYLIASKHWDPETGQWWNWVNMSPALDKAVAITP